MKLLGLALIGIIWLGGCGKQAFIPSDRTIHDTPKNYPVISAEQRIYVNDEVTLQGWWIEPIEGNSKATIVVVNGIASNSTERFKKWLWVLDAGYDLFIFDYRGYGRSTGSFDINGFIEDVTVGLQYVERRSTKPIIVCGQSMGGSIVAAALARSAFASVELAVIDSTFISFASISDTIMRRSLFFWLLHWVPYTVIPSQINAIENIANIDVPLLFVAGMRDEVVPPQHTAILYAKATAPKRLWLSERSGHVRSFENPELQRAFIELADDIEGAYRRSDDSSRIFR